MTPEEFAERADVSRETLNQLIEYKRLLEKWQKRLNLVSAATLPDFWVRHVDDSAQLAPLLPRSARILFDLGSGAGFPGLVLAVMEKRLHTHLVESDQRKAAFLGEVCRAVGLARAVTIHASRIERLPEAKADVVTARALAPLSTLLGYAAKLLAPDGVCLFHKGARVEDELNEAMKIWRMKVERIASRTDKSGVILRISELAHV